MPELYARTQGGTLVRIYIKDSHLYEEPVQDIPALDHGIIPMKAEESYLRVWASLRLYKVVDILAAAEAQANTLGRSAGEQAAEWVFDGNTPAEEYGRVLNGIEEGDPAIMDAFTAPTLNGEWADGMTVERLLAELEVPMDIGEQDTARLGDAWEVGASEGFWCKLESICTLHLKGA
jgi:hypothetical protein